MQKTSIRRVILGSALFALIPFALGAVMYVFSHDNACGSQVVYFANCVTTAYAMMTVSAGWIAIVVVGSVIQYFFSRLKKNDK